jgi:hypothetical protein
MVDQFHASCAKQEEEEVHWNLFFIAGCGATARSVGY